MSKQWHATDFPGAERERSSIIEIAIGKPDDKHLTQIGEILETTDREVWLITRGDRVAAWKNEVCQLFGKKVVRIVVTSVESFVGQNITELAGFSSSGKIARLAELVDLYNSNRTRSFRSLTEA